MHIHLISNSDCIVRFVESAFTNSGYTVTFSNSYPSLAECTQHSENKSITVILDIDHPNASLIAETACSAGNGSAIPQLPMVSLVNSKNRTTHEPALPSYAWRLRKPFCIEGLLQAIRCTTEHCAGNTADEMLYVADLTFNGTKGTVIRGGKIVKPHPREILLLGHLLRHKGTVVSREYILNNLFDYTAQLRPNLVDVLACRLRQRLHKGYDQPIMHTIRGKGYMITEE